MKRLLLINTNTGNLRKVVEPPPTCPFQEDVVSEINIRGLHLNAIEAISYCRVMVGDG